MKEKILKGVIMSLFNWLTVVFIVLKLVGIISWPWILVISPTLAIVILYLVIAIIVWIRS